ncbi:hypothetical protein F8388_014409 [Cannabis sativa]|uniref:Uncharacterized protein n=1 Tax=Cannabis sativa TaxID=3483 RepID=A0A7J6FYN3_CANSA|nr:hypothetical protein F8388_014409 [Cannabis sativa]
MAIAISSTLLLHLPPKPKFTFPSTNPNPRYLNPNFHGNSRLQLPKTPFSYSRNGSETNCPVPLDQQPINEYQTLSTSFPFSWASGDFVEYCSRLAVTGASFALLIGLPVAWSGAVGPNSEPVKRLLCVVSNEETGWYDGQMWVKTTEVLARDRLLGSFSVKPVLSRLKYTLVGLGLSLLVCIMFLVNIDETTQTKNYEDDEMRVIHGVYNDDSARSFEPDAFCGEPPPLP